MLRAQKITAAAAVIAILGVGVALAIDKRPDSPGPGASSEDLVAAAREAYEARVKRWPLDPEHVHFDEIYLWSKRWMTAEWDLFLQAGGGARGVKAHLTRMADLEKLIIEANKAGSASSDDVAAAKYYRIEAELMFARAGG